jgi:hypothetical protein
MMLWEENGAMLVDFVSAFLGGFGGVAAGFLLVKWLGAKFIETQLAKAVANHQHELDKQLATLEGGMSRLGDVLSRRNEREFAVVEGAWKLLIKALGSLQVLFSPARARPGFGAMSEEEALVLVNRLPFTRDEKDRLRNCDPAAREALYSVIDVAREYPECEREWGAFKTFLNTQQIFFSPEIHDAFVSLRNDLHNVIALAQMFIGEEQGIPTQDRIQMNRWLRAADDKTEALAVQIRARFGFGET